MPTLSDYIVALQELEKQVGGLVSVEKWMPAKGRHEAPLPKVAWARRYERSGVPAFYNEAGDTLAQKGDPVIRV